MLLFLVAAAIAGSLPPDVRPWPIGVGPDYRIPAAPAAVRRGAAVGSFRCLRPGAPTFAVHVELFAHRRVVIVPAGIGVSRPRWDRFGQRLAGRCTYPLSTADTSGVVHVRSPGGARLADLFRIWGRPLGRRTLAGFRSRTPLVAFVDGRRWRGDPRAIPLARHGQIVLELGGYVPPHPRYLFPDGPRARG